MLSYALITEYPIGGAYDEELKEDVQSFFISFFSFCEHVGDLSEVHQKEGEGDSCEYGGDGSYCHVGFIYFAAEPEDVDELDWLIDVLCLIFLIVCIEEWLFFGAHVVMKLRSDIVLKLSKGPFG